MCTAGLALASCHPHCHPAAHGFSGYSTSHSYRLPGESRPAKTHWTSTMSHTQFEQESTKSHTAGWKGSSGRVHHKPRTMCSRKISPEMPEMQRSTVHLVLCKVPHPRRHVNEPLELNSEYIDISQSQHKSAHMIIYDFYIYFIYILLFLNYCGFFPSMSCDNCLKSRLEQI